MDDVKAEVLSLLRGKTPSNDDYFKRIHVAGTANTLKSNVCYIVAAVLLRRQLDSGDDEILMIQEAKQSCRGKWYLPAGRLEKSETLVDGAKREVLEESGLEFEPNALLTVEFQSLNWIRFMFTGPVTGGELKTEERVDSESLQAQWIPCKQLMSKEWQRHLRCPDILPLIEQTLQWYSKDEKRKVTVLPSLVPLTHTFVRTILIEKYGTGSESRFHVFAGHRSSPSVPMACVSRSDSLHSACVEILQSSGYKGSVRIIGACCVEHMGQSSHPPTDFDGVCFTILLSPTPSQPVASATHCWLDVDDTLTSQLIEQLMLPNGSISLMCF